MCELTLITLKSFQPHPIFNLNFPRASRMKTFDSPAKNVIISENMKFKHSFNYRFNYLSYNKKAKLELFLTSARLRCSKDVYYMRIKIQSNFICIISMLKKFMLKMCIYLLIFLPIPTTNLLHNTLYLSR